MNTKKYCPHIYHGLVFYFQGLSCCNKVWNNSFDCSYEGDLLENFLEYRNNLINNLKNGNIQESCKSCLYLTDEMEPDLNEKIKAIELYHWHQCNCACFYCSNRDTTKLKITEETDVKGVFDTMPILRKMKKMDLLDDNLQLNFVGGEPTILKEFPDILNFALANNYDCHILSNGIIYDENISKVLNSSKNSTFTISLDCSSKFIFKKIKAVDKYEQVLKNIKQYIQDTGENSNRIIIKYILLPRVNDNKEEIDKWIKICKDMGVTKLFPTIEFCHLDNFNKVFIKRHICQMYDYMKSQILKNGLRLETYDFVEDILKNRTVKVK